MKLFSLIFISLIALSSCQNDRNASVNETDTCVVAYIDQGSWRFNTAQIWAKTDRKWAKDSGLDAEMAVVRQIRLQLTPVKSDSIMDSVKHSLLKVIPRYGLPLPDSLTHYIHILDTLHYH